MIGGGITAARKYIMPALLGELRAKMRQLNGDTLDRVQMKVYDLDDEAEFAAFARGDMRPLQVYGSGTLCGLRPAEAHRRDDFEAGRQPRHFRRRLRIRPPPCWTKKRMNNEETFQIRTYPSNPLIWGGDKIAPYKGIDTSMPNIGESWELSGVAGDESVVAGAYAGRTLPQLIDELKETLVRVSPSTSVSAPNFRCW